MKKKSKRLRQIGRMLFTLMILGLLSGCHPMSKETEQGNHILADEEYANNWDEVLLELKGKAPNEVPERVKVAVTENFFVDTEISISRELEEYQLEQVKMKRHIIEDDEKMQVLEKILDETQWCDKSELEHVEYAGAEHFVAEYENGKYDESLCFSFEGKDAWASDLSIAFQEYEFTNKMDLFTSFIYPSEESSIVKDYSHLLQEKEELDFMPLSEAENYVKEFSEGFGIEFGCETKTYTYSLQRLEEMSRLYEEYKQSYRPEYCAPSFSKEDELYVFIMQQGYRGVPIFPSQVSRGETNTDYVNTRCYAYLSQNGIETLRLQNMFDILEGSQTQEIISLGDVLEKYYEDYGNTKGIKETVVRIGLYYLPVLTDEEAEEFTAKPIWFVYSNVERSTYEGNVANRRTTIYDAVTGEKMIW